MKVRHGQIGSRWRRRIETSGDRALAACRGVSDGSHPSNPFLDGSLGEDHRSLFVVFSLTTAIRFFTQLQIKTDQRSRRRRRVLLISVHRSRKNQCPVRRSSAESIEKSRAEKDRVFHKPVRVSERDGSRFLLWASYSLHGVPRHSGSTTSSSLIHNRQQHATMEDIRNQMVHFYVFFLVLLLVLFPFILSHSFKNQVF